MHVRWQFSIRVCEFFLKFEWNVVEEFVVTEQPIISDAAHRPSRVLQLVNALLACLVPIVWWSIASSTLRSLDFTAYRTAWELMLKTPHSLYDLSAQTAVQRALVPGKFANGLLVFNYPPFAATLFGGLGALPHTVAYLVWGGLNLGLLAAIVWQLRPIWLGWSPATKRASMLALLAFGPLTMAFVQGAFSLWIALGVVGFVVGLRESRDFSAGVWLGLVSFKPQYLPLFIVFAVAARRWRAVAGAATAGLVLIASSVPFVGIEGWQGFFSTLRSFSVNGNRSNARSEMMWNVRGLATRLFEGHGLSVPSEAALEAARHDRIISIISSLVLVAAMIATARVARRWPLRASLPLTVLLAVVASPHTHIHDVVIVVAAAAFMIDNRKAIRTWALMPAICALAIPMNRSPFGMVPLAFLAIAAWQLRSFRGQAAADRVEGDVEVIVPGNVSVSAPTTAAVTAASATAASATL